MNNQSPMENGRRMVRVALSPHLIRMMAQEGYELHRKCVKGLPADAEWFGEVFDQLSCRVFFIFRHPSFELVPFNMELPTLDVIYEDVPTS